MVEIVSVPRESRGQQEAAAVGFGAHWLSKMRSRIHQVDSALAVSLFRLKSAAFDLRRDRI
eukprot:scaffold8520_cov248-Pinguiococcus_pyrenoidosus.AAC.6